MKYINLLRITRLLTSREAVPLKEIMRVCGVSRATAYRYVQTIRDADLPLRYDRVKRTYSLQRAGSTPAAKMSLNDSLLVCFSVALMASFLDEPLAGKVRNLLTSLLSDQELPVDNIVLSAMEMLTNGSARSSLPQALNLFLLQAAATAHRKVAVTTGDNGSGSMELEYPTVRLGAHCTLSGEARGGRVSIPLAKVRQVSVQ